MFVSSFSRRVKHADCEPPHSEKISCIFINLTYTKMLTFLTWKAAYKLIVEYTVLCRF